MGLFGPPNVEKMKTRRDVDGLIKALSYQKSGKFRQQAAWALGVIGDARAVESLIVVLKDKDAWVRRVAAEVLGKIGTPAVEPLIAALKDEDVHVREAATVALGKIGDSRAVEPLITALKDKDPMGRAEAANTLGEIGDARAVEPLVAMLKDEHMPAAASALDKLGWKPGKDDASIAYFIIKQNWEECVRIGAPAVEPLIIGLIAVLRGSNWGARIKAIEMLGEIGDARATEPLIAALEDRDGDENLRNKATEALAKIGDARAVAPLITRLNHRNEEVRQAAAEWLVKIGKPAVEPLITRLNHRDEEVCQAAAEELVKIGKPAVEPLIAALKDKNVSVRDGAVEVLGKIGDTRAVEPLIAALKGNYFGMREAEALGLICDARAVGPLITSLESDDLRVLKAAHEALVKIGAPAVEPLIAAIKDSDKDVRQRAVEVLGKIGDARAAESLIAALKDSDKSVRQAVAVALDQLSWRPGKDENGAWYWIAKQQWDQCIKIRLPAVKPLLAALKDNDKDIRQEAAGELDQLGWRPGKDENGARYWIVKRKWDQCSEIGAPAVEPLIDALRENDLKVRQVAKNALIKLGMPAVEPLIIALKDSNQDVRQVAAWVLGQLGDGRAVESLIAALKDSCFGVRHPAAEALGQLGDRRAVEPLIAALKDRNKDVRQMAAETLDKLGWRPGSDENGVWYWAAKGQWDQCIEIGVPAVQPLIACLTLYDQDSARAVARILVGMYRTGSLGEGQKSLILAQRYVITSHTDKPSASSIDRCDGSHNDSPHTDQGLSVDFPL